MQKLEKQVPSFQFNLWFSDDVAHSQGWIKKGWGDALWWIKASNQFTNQKLDHFQKSQVHSDWKLFQVSCSYSSQQMLYTHVWAASCLLISIKCSVDIKGTDRIKSESSETQTAFLKLAMYTNYYIYASFFFSSNKSINEHLKWEESWEEWPWTPKLLNNNIFIFSSNKDRKKIWKQHNKISKY